jgi:hypothetical protein
MDGRRDGRGAAGGTLAQRAPRSVVAPWPVRAPRGAGQRRHGPRLPLPVLRGPAPGGQPPQPGGCARPHQRHLPGLRRPPGDRRAGGLRPTHLLRAPRRWADPVPTVPDQPVDARPQPRLTRRDGPGSRPRLPAAHPVRGDRGRHRLRPGHPGHRFGRGPQRHLLALLGGRPHPARVPRPGRAPRARVDLGLGSLRGGSGRRSRPARRIRRALPPPDPGPGAGQSDHPGDIRPHPLPRRQPVHLTGRAAGQTVRRAHGRPAPAVAGRRLGGGQLAPRRRFALGLRGRLQPLHLTGRPTDGLRAGQRPGRHPDHPGRSGSGGVRPGDPAGRFRIDRRPGLVRRARLPGGQLLVAHSLRRAGLCLARTRATGGPPAAPTPVRVGARPDQPAAR